MQNQETGIDGMLEKGYREVSPTESLGINADRKRLEAWIHHFITVLLDKYGSETTQLQTLPCDMNTLRHFSDRAGNSLDQLLVCQGSQIILTDKMKNIDLSSIVILYPCVDKEHYLVKVYDQYSFAYLGVNNTLERVSKEPIIRQTYRATSEQMDEKMHEVATDIHDQYCQILRMNV